MTSAMVRTIHEYAVIDLTCMAEDDPDYAITIADKLNELGPKGFGVVHRTERLVILSRPTGQEFIQIELPAWAQIAQPGAGARVM